MRMISLLSVLLSGMMNALAQSKLYNELYRREPKENLLLGTLTVDTFSSIWKP